MSMRRRVHLRDVSNGRAPPSLIHRRSLMEELAELHLLELVVVRSVVEADEVADAADRHRGLELVGLRDQPVGQLAAVADTFDRHAFAIDPQIAPDRRADAVQDVLPFIAVRIAKHGVGELLAVAGRAAVIHMQRGPPVRRRKPGPGS